MSSRTLFVLGLVAFGPLAACSHKEQATGQAQPQASSIKKSIPISPEAAAKPQQITVHETKDRITVGAAEAITEAELGIPFFPSAHTVNSVRLNTPGAKQITVELATTEAVGKVADFYQKAMADKGKLSSIDTPNMKNFILEGKDKTFTNILIQRDGSVTKILLQVGRT